MIEQFLLFSGTWNAAGRYDVMSDHRSEGVAMMPSATIVLILQYILGLTFLQEYSETVRRSFC